MGGGGEKFRKGRDRSGWGWKVQTVHVNYLLEHPGGKMLLGEGVVLNIWLPLESPGELHAVTPNPRDSDEPGLAWDSVFRIY